MQSNYVNNFVTRRFLLKIMPLVILVMLVIVSPIFSNFLPSMESWFCEWARHNEKRIYSTMSELCREKVVSTRFFFYLEMQKFQDVIAYIFIKDNGLLNSQRSEQGNQPPYQLVISTIRFYHHLEMTTRMTFYNKNLRFISISILLKYQNWR